MTVEVIIRSADLSDAPLLAEIGRISFDDAFSSHPANDPKDMAAYMNEAFDEQTIASELNDPNSHYFIAEVGGNPAGYAKIKTNSIEDGIVASNPVELCRLYSLTEFIGCGIGKALMLKTLEFAKNHEADVLWLGVWEFNLRAQDFYRRFGFEKCGEHTFLLGSDPQTDWLMTLKLTDHRSNL
jgi:ribosomal protein S18 acetylase RimI-like enzyme